MLMTFSLHVIDLHTIGHEGNLSKILLAQIFFFSSSNFPEESPLVLASECKFGCKDGCRQINEGINPREGGWRGG